MFDVSQRHHTDNIACGAGSLFLDAALGAKDKLSSYFILFYPAGCKYNQVNSHFHCIREGCQFSFLLKHQMTSHARKHMRRMLGKNFDRVPSQVQARQRRHVILKSGIIKIQAKHLNGLKPVLNSLLKHILTKHTPFSWEIK